MTNERTTLGYTDAELAKLPEAQRKAIRAAATARATADAKQRFAEYSYQCARAIGRPAPMNPAEQATAIRDFRADNVVDAAAASRAKAARADLDKMNWAFELDKPDPESAAPVPDAPPMMGAMARAANHGRPVALARTEAPAPPGASPTERLQAWRARNANRRFQATALPGTNTLELSLFGVIGESWIDPGVTANDVKRALDEHPEATSIKVLIDSPGGDAFMGIAIQSLLKRSGKLIDVEIVGEASSAASVVAMAGDTIAVHEGAMMMIHRASSIAIGTAEDLRQTAVALDKLTDSITDVYVARTGKPKAEIERLVSAETWMTAKEAVELGFATSVAPAKAAT